MIQRYYFAEIPVDAGPRREIRETVVNWMTEGEKPRQVITLNATMLITALKNARLKQIIRNADLVTADGYSIMLALKKRGFWTERFPGVELADQLLKFCIEERLRVYCYGGSKETVFWLRRKFASNGLMIIREGFDQNEDLIREEIVKVKPILLLTGLGSPRQEIFLDETLPYLTATVGMGIGGAFEVISGQKSRPPAILRDNGWEWCCRMVRDPKKLKHLPELAKFWYLFLK